MTPDARSKLREAGKRLGDVSQRLHDRRTKHMTDVLRRLKEARDRVDNKEDYATLGPWEDALLEDKNGKRSHGIIAIENGAEHVVCETDSEESPYPSANMGFIAAMRPESGPYWAPLLDAAIEEVASLRGHLATERMKSTMAEAQKDIEAFNDEEERRGKGE